MVARPRPAEAQAAVRLLVVDASIEGSRAVRDLFAGHAGFRVHAARTIEEARGLFADATFDAALVDYDLWMEDGSELMGLARQHRPDLAIVLLTSENEREALPALKLGAHDFISRRHADGEQAAARILAAIAEARTARRRDTMVRWLEREARIDHLTGLYNRRAFDERLRDECAASRRANAPVGLIAIDIAGTGVVNDAHGADAGDAMIRRAAAGITRAIRGADFAARIAGDDFAVILPGGDLDLCRRIARRIAHEVERLNAEEWGKEIPGSLTFGVASGVGCEPGEIFAAADVQAARGRGLRWNIMPFPCREASDGPSVA